ncbi:MAG: UDP-N-acetylglucosamine 1-carboxyvinyltransferase [Aggregatilineales bacterium]
MEQFIIEGGHPLNGEVTPGGNKNAILKMLPACILTDKPVTLNNVPDIADVRVTIDIMRGIGVKIEWTAPNQLNVHAENVDPDLLDLEMARKTRASFVLAGPLLARFGRATLPAPGGDFIGERRLDTHIEALRAMGVEVEYQRNLFVMRVDKKQSTDILLREASVTGTENTVMAAVLGQTTTVIRNAASEPHVQDLCHMLVSMGARIDGIGSNRLIIVGVEKLNGCEARVGADFMEVGSFIGVAVMTGGEIRIKDADPHYLDMVKLVFERLGVTWQVEGQDILVPASQALTIKPDIGNRIPRIKAQFWPGFPPDLMSIAVVVATQSAGAVMFHDWMYESRLFFTDKLVRMGARITLADPHRALVQGPTTLRAAPFISSPDIRAGMSILLAALAAKGETRISNIVQIDRGYERVEEKLAALGANIRRVEVDKTTTSEMANVEESQVMKESS